MTGTKGPVHSQTPASGNSYDKNFQNRFCGCGEFYDAQSQKGTMYQCLGLATEQDGGCGEDWWHPECLLGLNRRWMDGVKPEHVTPTEKEDLSPNANAEENADETQSPPPGFPSEDDFDGFICYKCVDANPWIKKYAGTAGFLDPVFKDMPRSESVPLEKNEKHSEELISSSILVPPQHPSGTNTTSGVEIGNCSTTPVNHILSTFYETQKSKPSNAILSNADIVYPNGEQNSDESHSTASSPHVNLVGPSKKRKSEDATEDLELDNLKKPKLDTETRPYHESLPPASTDSFSLFLREGFRDHFCRCAACYSLLRAHPQLLEEEESYEPPLSEDGNEGRESVGTGSLLDRGEAALNNIDRVRAIGEFSSFAIRTPIPTTSVFWIVGYEVKTYTLQISEGVMVYNHLKDKVKSFLQPFAASGQPVGAEDIKAYFEKLRGDDEAIKAAGGRTVVAGDGEEPEGGHRRAQSG